MFIGKFYDQIDGVAMGSPSGPVLANIFLPLLEEKALQCSMVTNIMFTIDNYVDNTFLIINCKDDSIIFSLHIYMNTQHKNIRIVHVYEA